MTRRSSGRVPIREAHHVDLRVDHRAAGPGLPPGGARARRCRRRRPRRRSPSDHSGRRSSRAVSSSVASSASISALGRALARASSRSAARASAQSSGADAGVELPGVEPELAQLVAEPLGGRALRASAASSSTCVRASLAPLDRGGDRRDDARRIGEVVLADPKGPARRRERGASVERRRARPGRPAPCAAARSRRRPRRGCAARRCTRAPRPRAPRRGGRRCPRRRAPPTRRSRRRMLVARRLDRPAHVRVDGGVDPAQVEPQVRGHPGPVERGALDRPRPSRPGSWGAPA